MHAMFAMGRRSRCRHREDLALADGRLQPALDLSTQTMLISVVSCKRFNAENLPSPLFLTDKASSSYFWKSLAKPIRHSLVDRPYAMENHKNGAGGILLSGAAVSAASPTPPSRTRVT